MELHKPLELDRFGLKCVLPELIAPTVKRCYSPNMLSFFRKKRNRSLGSVIRHQGSLYFATIFEGVNQQDYWKREYSEWVGVRVATVACYGSDAQTGWYTSQNNSGFEDVTEWFWENYLREGMYGIYEIWHRDYPVAKTHREFSQA